MTTTTNTMTDYLCTNGGNSSFRVKAIDAQAALTIAEARFDGDCSYILPITVQSEDGDVADIY